MTLRLMVIVGPTATGKTRLAVEVAHRVGSEIVSVDSRQVYVGLDIGTGKDLEEYSRVDPPVPYHMIDVCDPRQVFTLFDFQQECYRLLRKKASEDRFGSGEVPLLMAGGSGLYVEAVLKGYRIADVPENPELRHRLMKHPHAELVERLLETSPDLHRETDLTSTKRVVRALEIAEHARSSALRSSTPLDFDFDAEVFGVQIDRGELRRRIAVRVDHRLDHGMVEEVRSLLAGEVSHERLQMLGLEYRVVGDYLRGELTYEEMRETLNTRIGQFAKRQMTYFRGMERRGTPIRWVSPDESSAVLGSVVK
jgi:tRNA dimethylallyltransferase